MTKQVFKPYNKDQMTFLPIDLGTLIPQNHMVRVIDKAIDRMDMTAILILTKAAEQAPITL